MAGTLLPKRAQTVIGDRRCTTFTCPEINASITLRPASQQHGLLRLDSFGLKQAVGMCDQKWRRIGNRQVTNAHGRVRFLRPCFIAPEQGQGTGSGKQRRQLQCVTAGQIVAGEAIDTHEWISGLVAANRTAESLNDVDVQGTEFGDIVLAWLG